jgi:hypothetical protein
MPSSEVNEGSPAFHLLADLIAGDDLVAITGAGISYGLKRKGGADGVPGWEELLRRIHERLKPSIDARENAEISDVLAASPVPTQCLLEAASRLRESDSMMYEAELLSQVTPEPGQFSETHSALELLNPRGIITFNYDDCHESAHEDQHGKEIQALTPYTENSLVEHLSSRLSNRFLLKAHGSIHDSTGPLVLDWSSYRSLLSKQPVYRAFFQNVLTNFNCLFVGFSLSDPDFDTFVDSIASVYGSPVSEHVAIRHLDHSSPEEFVWRRRYGITCLHVSSYDRIPELIAKASKTAGPKLRSCLDLALSTDISERQIAHRRLERLGILGKRCASEAFKYMLLEESDEFLISEIVYSLGVIDAYSNKETIMEQIANPTHSTAAPAGRALTVLRPALSPSDLPRIAEWQAYYETHRFADDPQNRLMQYCDYYLVYVPSKFAS